MTTLDPVPTPAPPLDTTLLDAAPSELVSSELVSSETASPEIGPLDVQTVAALPEPEVVLSGRARLAEFGAGTIDTRWALGLAAAWAAVMFGEWLLVPAPADPEASDPAWVVALGVVMLGLVVAGLTGVALRRRRGVVISGAAAALGIVSVLACPLSGHHDWAMWWVGDFALWTAFGLLHIEALRRSHEPADSQASGY